MGLVRVQQGCPGSLDRVLPIGCIDVLGNGLFQIWKKSVYLDVKFDTVQARRGPGPVSEDVMGLTLGGVTPFLCFWSVVVILHIFIHQKASWSEGRSTNPIRGLIRKPELAGRLYCHHQLGRVFPGVQYCYFHINSNLVMPVRASRS